MTKDARRVTLPSGVRLIMIPRPEAIATSIMVAVETGSKYETPAQSGLSHFLEHMCFKGTTKHPTALSIAAEFDAMGAQNNAFTSQEFTGYYATVEPDQASRALSLLAEMYLEPTLPEPEIQKEKGVIVEEINMYEDEPRRNVHNVLMRAVYGDQPAGRPILGTIDSVRAMTRQDFVKYRRAHYVASKTIVTIAGKFDPATIKRQVAKEFAAVSPGRRQGKEKVKDAQKAPVAQVLKKDSDQTHLALAFRALAANHPDYYAAEVLGAILGGGMGSRLWQVVREELGAAYYVGGGHDSYTDHGLMVFSAGIESSRLDQVLPAMLGECRRLTSDLVPAEELARVKQSLVGNLMLGLERASNLGWHYTASEILTGELVSPQVVARKLRAVTAEEVRRVARKIFSPTRLSAAVIGPLSDSKVVERLLTL